MLSVRGGARCTRRAGHGGGRLPAPAATQTPRLGVALDISRQAVWSLGFPRQPKVYAGNAGIRGGAMSRQRDGLRAALTAAMAEHGCTMDGLTVLDKANDPFRVDTPAGHRDGGWLAALAESWGSATGPCVSAACTTPGSVGPKPDGEPYSNTEKDWLWLSGGGQGGPVPGPRPVRPDRRPAQRRAGDPGLGAPDAGAYLSTRAQRRAYPTTSSRCSTAPTSGARSRTSWC